MSLRQRGRVDEGLSLHRDVVTCSQTEGSSVKSPVSCFVTLSLLGSCSQSYSSPRSLTQREGKRVIVFYKTLCHEPYRT